MLIHNSEFSTNIQPRSEKIAKKIHFLTQNKIFSPSARPFWARGLTLKCNKLTGWAGLAWERDGEGGRRGREFFLKDHMYLIIRKESQKVPH